MSNSQVVQESQESKNPEIWRRWLYGAIWVGFVAYAIVLAPPDDPETFAIILKLSTGQVAELNPCLVSLFNLMGVWPMIYGCMLLADGHGRSPRAWPFLAGSFAVGAFAVLPYLGLRRSLSGDTKQDFTAGQVWGLQIWDSRWFALVLLVGAIALSWYGVTQGDWGEFSRQWQTSKFVHVMGLDFCALTLLFPTLVADDLLQRGSHHKWWIPITCLPLIGPLLYLVFRPSLFQALQDQ